MPQGVLISIKPISLVFEKALTATEIDNPNNGCEGKVEILDGDYAGKTGYFNQQGDCCEMKEGENINFNIIGEEDGKVWIEFLSC